MRKLFFLCAALCWLNAGYAQKLKLEKLEQLLNASLDEAEEELFLTGYSFLSEKNKADTTNKIYIFSNRKNTIGTAKFVWKGIYTREPLKSFVKYVTYDRNEFEHFRKLMIQNQFERLDPKSIDENSSYSKENLHVNFEVTKDEYDNVTFMLTLTNLKSLSKAKALRRISVKDLFKQREE
ncbi:hypothetical protein ACFSJU_09455 [Paradesertivirga mongoliensis]|uniref:DUF4252 domain-containing protein n=1 Tax=Paradesertivirga mongoliensis TaxID=2100740 RepID=A0ABW4ZKK1_9SPHI|nr:hypothetical protein [Pedobacter mongoliensis]